MSDQDTIQVTERLEKTKLKNQIFEHAARHSTSIDEAASDIIVRGTMVTLSRQTPPVLILKGTVKILQAYRELIVEGVMSALNDNEPTPEPEQVEPEKKENNG